MYFLWGSKAMDLKLRYISEKATFYESYKVMKYKVQVISYNK